jgi:hypothetical protein
MRNKIAQIARILNLTWIPFEELASPLSSDNPLSVEFCPAERSQSARGYRSCLFARDRMERGISALGPPDAELRRPPAGAYCQRK